MHLAVVTDKSAQEPIRKGFGLGLLEAGKRNPNVVAACADLTDSTQIALFKKEFPIVTLKLVSRSKTSSQSVLG